MAATFIGDLEPDIADKIRCAGASRNYPARSYVFHEGDAGNGVFVVESGLLRIDRTTADGKVALLELAFEGALIGELSVIDNHPRSATLSTVSTATVRHVSTTSFQEMLREDPAIQSAVMQRLARRLRALSSQFLETSIMDAPARIASRLLRLIEIEQTLGRSNPDATGAISLKLPISQQELGQWSGLSREGTVKGLAVLRSLDILTTGRMRVHVADPGRLAAVATSS